MLCLSQMAGAQTAGFSFSTDKQFYRTDEVLRVNLSFPSQACYALSSPVYIRILNNAMEPVKQLVVKSVRGSTVANIYLTDLDTGYYLLQAYNQPEGGPSSLQQIAFGMNIPADKQVKELKHQLSLYPESGQALLNHTTRFAVYLKTQTGKPVQEKILVRNKAGLLIAIINTAANGWQYVDLPVVAKDELSFTTGGGELLTILRSDSSPFVKNYGFAISAEPAAGLMQVEIKKAEGEMKRKAVLEVFYNDVLLHDATAFFNSDTTIVGTQFRADGLANKLLRLILKDASGNIVTERLVMMPAVTTDTEATVLQSEIDCRADGPIYATGYSFLAGPLNNQLIPFQLKHTDPERNPAGFSLVFQNKLYAGKTIDYAILQGDANLLQGGEITADLNGIVRINNCDFSGEAVIQFYENNKQVMPFTNVAYPGTNDVNDEGILLLNNLAGDNVAGKSFAALANGQTINNGDDKVKELKGVSVSATKRSSLTELDNKYVSNGMFKNMSGRQVNVEDDEMAVNYTLTSFLMKSFPGITSDRTAGKINGMTYRLGYLDFYLDEQVVDFLAISSLHLRDIGYIKFFTTPVRGGMAEQKGGQLLRGNSYAAGLQGSVAVYTRKYTAQEVSGIEGLPIRGYVKE